MTYYNVQDSMYITTSGSDVGIGITNPSKKLDVSGDINVSSGNDYNINGSQVLSATTLGSSVVNSSLTSNTGNFSNTGTMNVSSGNDYQINSASVLNATTLGSAVVDSSLQNLGTQDAALNMGSQNITSVADISAANVNASSNADINGTLDVAGASQLQSLNVTADSSFDGYLDLNKTSSTASLLSLKSGNANSVFNDGAQIQFSHNATDDYKHFIHTRHNSANSNNAIDFYTCDGTQANSLTSGSTHSMSIVSGNVGVGITNPQYELDVSGDINLTGDLKIAGVTQSFGGGSSVWTESGGEAYYTGNVGIGTDATNPDFLLEVKKNQNTFTQINVENLTNDTNASAVVKCQADSGAMWMQAFATTYNTSDAHIADGGLLSTGTGSAGGLAIRSYATEGDMTFWTGGNNKRMTINSDGNIGIGTDDPSIDLAIGDNDTGFNEVSNGIIACMSNGTEVMRFDTNGNVGIGGTPSSNHRLFVQGQSGDVVGRFYRPTTSGLVNVIEVRSNVGGTDTLTMTIDADGDCENTNNSYTGFSDIRLKENIVDANSQWDDLKNIRVVNYNFKHLPEQSQLGVIADEVELVSSGLVKQTENTINGYENVKSVKYSILYMKCVKALQEAQLRIEELETKVETLTKQMDHVLSLL